MHETKPRAAFAVEPEVLLSLAREVLEIEARAWMARSSRQSG